VKDHKYSGAVYVLLARQIAAIVLRILKERGETLLADMPERAAV
jgi:hypothetical protein